jgi:predicted dehydrogenase
MKPLRLAVIGVGHLGRIHARILSTLPGIELIGVADPLESNRAAAAAEYGTTPYADYRALIGRIDAAVVAAPSRLHHEIGLELLNRGIHLLIEKPLTTRLAEAEELVHAARRHGAVLQAGHIERFNPAFAAALPHVRGPKFIQAQRLGGFTGRSTDIGVVLDLMIHDLDLVLSLARSPVRQVEALGISLLGGHEDAAHARLEFENGCVAVLNASRISYRASRTMEIWSERAFAALDFAARKASLVHPAESILQGTFDADALPSDERCRLKDELFATLLRREELEVPAADQITAELEDFADSIRTGRAPRVSGEQARDAIAVAQQVLQQIATHLWDGRFGGRTGPHALPPPSIIAGPHWDRRPQHSPARRREAG